MGSSKPRAPLRVEGVTHSPGADLYHRLLEMSWLRLFLTAGATYLTVNAGFASLYMLGEAPLAQARPGSFEDAFFFSVQAFSTIGFGAMYPQTLYGHVLVTVQTFMALFAMAGLTGLVFAKFSLPTARVRFSRSMVVAPHDGVPTLQFRMANERANQIVEATVNVVALVEEPTREGTPFRRLYDLRLVRHRSPTFTLGWVVMHPIDEQSPLFGWGPAELEARDVGFQVSLTGVDGTHSQTIQARHRYEHDEVDWNHRFVDILHRSDDGGRIVKMQDFDETVGL